jgi:hypothetical protein
MDETKKQGYPAAPTGALREKLHAPKYDLVPFREMVDAYVRVAEFGAKKYDAWNWSKGLSRIQILTSLLNHTWAYLRGEEKDRESGLLHTDHILWNAVTLVHNVEWGLEDGRRVEPSRAYKEEVKRLRLDEIQPKPTPEDIRRHLFPQTPNEGLNDK